MVALCDSKIVHIQNYLTTPHKMYVDNIDVMVDIDK